ncbi:MAG: hypothetical protein IKF97_07295 [Clostridia bacterium]|nr:hypothetical protein [Clostridia bacterium]
MSKIIDFFKMFSSSSEAELTEEENILNDETLSKEEKQELIKTLKETDKIAHKLWADDLKVAKNIKVEKNDEKADLIIDSKLINSKRIADMDNKTKGRSKGIAR